VAGLTIRRASAQRDKACESATQKARSTGRSRGRDAFRFRIASCFLSARF